MAHRTVGIHGWETAGIKKYIPVGHVYGLIKALSACDRGKSDFGNLCRAIVFTNLLGNSNSRIGLPERKS